MADSGTVHTIGKYTILETIGRGSMGIVYKAQDPEIGRTVAIKVLRRITGDSVFTEEAALERFRTEARSAGNLRHPSIITIFEVSTENESPYLVMDHVEGEGLDRRLERLEKLSIHDAMHIIAQVASALDYAHGNGVIHRDIKPSNVLIDRVRRAYVLDFGVAHMGGSPDGSEPVMGTPSYMSPEQILNKDVDNQTDLFSLGVMAFECFSGKRPFSGRDSTAVLTNILKGIRHDLTAVAPELPLALEAEFDKALAFGKEERFRTGAEMVRAFGAALGLDNDFMNALVMYSRSDSPRKAAPETGISVEGGFEASEIKEWPASPGNVLFGNRWKTPKKRKNPSTGTVAGTGTGSTGAGKKGGLKPGRLPPRGWQLLLLFFASACVAMGAFLIWKVM